MVAKPIQSRRRDRSDDEMIAAALEAPRALLPYLPELLADLEELGSDATVIVQVLKDLHLPPTSLVIDLGCGKGATSIAIAAELGFHVMGVDLFEPFVAHAREAARQAGVGGLCEFRHANAGALGQFPPADAVVFAALGDVLGSPRETMRILRQHVRSGGFVIVADVFLREGGSTAFAGFEHYVSRRETVNGLTAWCDTLVREVIEPEFCADDDQEEIAAIRRRAIEIALRHPELETELLAFAQSQADANAHISANLIGAVWAVRRA